MLEGAHNLQNRGVEGGQPMLYGSSWGRRPLSAAVSGGGKIGESSLLGRRLGVGRASENGLGRAIGRKKIKTTSRVNAREESRILFRRKRTSLTFGDGFDSGDDPRARKKQARLLYLYSGKGSHSWKESAWED